jgi:hypothetical protein
VAILGNYAITWADSDHAGTERQHALRVPPQRIRPGIRGNVHRAVSLDFTAQETVVLGTAHEASFYLRADKNPRGLADLAEAGIKGATLNIYDLEQPDRTIAVKLVEPYDVWLSVFDPESAYREWQTELRVRRTDGSAFPDWFLYGARGADGLLFYYEPGMDLSAATFTRASTATYLDVAGATTTAATNVARDGHYQLVSGVFTRTLRMENAETEFLSIPYAHVPQEMTVYVKAFDGTGYSSGGAHLFTVGNYGSGAALQLSDNGATADGRVFFRHDNGAAQSTAVLTPTGISDMALVEYRCVVNSDGSVLLGASVAGAAETTATDATTAAFASAWGAENIYIGNAYVAGSETDADFISIKVAAGVHTMDNMRAY